MPYEAELNSGLDTRILTRMDKAGIYNNVPELKHDMRLLNLTFFMQQPATGSLLCFSTHAHIFLL